MPDKLVDVRRVVGRKFVTKSNNICQIHFLGEGGLRCSWNNKPSSEDINEFFIWVKSILGETDYEIQDHGKTSEGALDKSKEEYKRWKRNLDLT